MKLFFALTNALFDAACCAWDNKCAFNSVRPITAIRTLSVGRRCWPGPGPYRGAKPIDGASWFPYQPSSFPTPRSSSTRRATAQFNAAGAEILALITSSDRFGGSSTLGAGNSKIELGEVPASDVTLSWPTFSDAADQAGLSRRYGGLHFEQADLDARAAGRMAARAAWQKAQRYWNGS